LSLIQIFDAYKPNESDPPRWDSVKLNVEVLENDFRVVRSVIGKYCYYIVIYDSVTDNNVKRWSKMHRVRFDLFFKRGGAVTSPLSNEENVVHPNLLPNNIEDPYYWLYSSYTHPSPDPPTGDNAPNPCDLRYAGGVGNSCKTNDVNATILNLEQIIKAPEETIPPEEQENRKLKNYIKTGATDNNKKAIYKFETFKVNNNTCDVTHAEKPILLRSLGIPEAEKELIKVIDAPVILI